jgi:hypothetical protein
MEILAFMKNTATKNICMLHPKKAISKLIFKFSFYFILASKISERLLGLEGSELTETAVAPNATLTKKEA